MFFKHLYDRQQKISNIFRGHHKHLSWFKRGNEQTCLDLPLIGMPKHTIIKTMMSTCIYMNKGKAEQGK